MPTYYCTDTQVTDLLPSLTNSQIDTEAKRSSKLRAPAKEWVDAVYPSVGPFPGISAATGYLVNGEVDAGELTLAIDGGSGNPVAGDFFLLEGHNSIYKVDVFSSLTVTFRRVLNFNPGVETITASGAMADIMDDTPIHFGTPMLVQTAAAWYAVSLGYQILRNNPEDKAVKAALERAQQTLQVGSDGLARARPYPYYEDARDVAAERLWPASVKLVRT